MGLVGAKPIHGTSEALGEGDLWVVAEDPTGFVHVRLGVRHIPGAWGLVPGAT